MNLKTVSIILFHISQNRYKDLFKVLLSVLIKTSLNNDAYIRARIRVILVSSHFVKPQGLLVFCLLIRYLRHNVKFIINLAF